MKRHHFVSLVHEPFLSFLVDLPILADRADNVK
jgi:hypothetical protein